MTRLRTLHDPPIFVTIDEAARRCMVSAETFRGWVQTGAAPPAAISRGQTMRWHWPTVEAALAGRREEAEDDPFMKGVQNVEIKPPHGRKRGVAA